jgi:Zn-dependent peptidase ImmA (M78 family)
MPEQFLRRDIAEMGGIDLTEDRPIRKLAQRYGVSVAMMALRLRQLQLTGDAG